MSLVHKTKHKTKKKTQKKQQIFKIKLRKDRFRMFGSHSKPISACFGRRLIQSNLTDTTQFCLNWLGLVGISVNQSRVSANLKKKKTPQTRHQRTSRASGAGVAPILPHPCIIDFYQQIRENWHCSNFLSLKNFSIAI